MDSTRQLLLAVKKIVRKYSINQILLVGWSKWSDNSIRQFDENSDKIVNDANHLDQLYKMLVSHFRQVTGQHHHKNNNTSHSLHIMIKTEKAEKARKLFDDNESSVGYVVCC